MAGFCFSDFCKNRFPVPAGYNHSQLCALPAQQVISFRCFAAYRSVNTATFVSVISFLRRDFPVFYLSSHLNHNFQEKKPEPVYVLAAIRFRKDHIFNDGAPGKVRKRSRIGYNGVIHTTDTGINPGGIYGKYSTGQILRYR